MSNDAPDSLRFPIGKFQKSTADPAQRTASIAAVRTLPSALREAISGLSESQLGTPYRDGGWTVLQTVHHIADSHLNAYSRFRQALAEEWPTIFAIDEAKWAQFVDARTAPVSLSMEMIDGIHARWAHLLETLSDADFQRGYFHPADGRQTLEHALALYAWHGRHHTSHITALRARNGW